MKTFDAPAINIDNPNDKNYYAVIDNVEYKIVRSCIPASIPLADCGKDDLNLLLTIGQEDILN